MATVGSGASNDSMALTAFSKLPTPPGRSIPLSIPTTPPFLAKITSIGKTVRVLCKECGEDKSIVYKTKFTLKVGSQSGTNNGLHPRTQTKTNKHYSTETVKPKATN